jgi:hypothetical protein
MGFWKMECDCSALRAQPALTNMRVAEVLVGESRPPAARTRNVLFFARGLPSWQVSRLASQPSWQVSSAPACKPVRHADAGGVRRPIVGPAPACTRDCSRAPARPGSLPRLLRSCCPLLGRAGPRERSLQGNRCRRKPPIRSTWSCWSPLAFVPAFRRSPSLPQLQPEHPDAGCSIHWRLGSAHRRTTSDQNDPNISPRMMTTTRARMGPAIAATTMSK